MRPRCGAAALKRVFFDFIRRICDRNLETLPPDICGHSLPVFFRQRIADRSQPYPRSESKRAGCPRVHLRPLCEWESLQFLPIPSVPSTIEIIPTARTPLRISTSRDSSVCGIDPSRVRPRTISIQLQVSGYRSRLILLAQRSLALRLRGFASTSSGVARTISHATAEYAPERSPARKDCLTRRSSPE